MMNNMLQFVKNPMQYLARTRLNIPQNFQGSASDMIQYLLNTGQLTQEQYNQVNQKARQIQDSPQFQQIQNMIPH